MTQSLVKVVGDPGCARAAQRMRICIYKHSIFLEVAVMLIGFCLCLPMEVQSQCFWE